MEHLFLLLVLMLGSYLLGSTMGAYWVSRWLNLPDPWCHGSGNPGATNMHRLGGWMAAVLTLVWDASKGAIGIALTLWLQMETYAQIFTAVAAVLGHMYPVFHHFKGGKGVATVLGCGLVLAPLTTLGLTLVWLLLLAWKRVSALASLGAACCAPWLSWWLNPDYTILFSVLALFIVFRHRQNINACFSDNNGYLD